MWIPAQLTSQAPASEGMLDVGGAILWYWDTGVRLSRRGSFSSEAGKPADPGFAYEDLNRLVEHLKLDKVHLLALALGAFYTMDFALVYP